MSHQDSKEKSSGDVDQKIAARFANLDERFENMMDNFSSINDALVSYDTKFDAVLEALKLYHPTIKEENNYIATDEDKDLIPPTTPIQHVFVQSTPSQIFKTPSSTSNMPRLSFNPTDFRHVENRKNDRDGQDVPPYQTSENYYHHANFRHADPQRNKKDSQSRKSYYDRHLSCDSFMEPITNILRYNPCA
jgi:hypothetical protein